MPENSLSPRKSPQDIADSIRGFRALHVLVVGDLFLDEYIEGVMYEISKEGPFPVIRIESRTRTPGAAGNLAYSIRKLGASVSTVGLVGEDSNGKALVSYLKAEKIRAGGIIVHPRMATLTYSKVRARVENTPSKELFRMDVLPPGPLDPRTEARLIGMVRREARGVNGIVVLDQIHHLVTEKLLKDLPAIARASGALLHGSSRDHLVNFRGFDLITPNDREAHGAVGGDPDDVERLAKALKEKGRHRKVLLTLGPRGMLALSDKGRSSRFSTFARAVVDVTGAGDAVSSVAALGNILGWDLETIAWTASQAAAIAVEHVGTHHVSLAELEQRILEA